MGMMAAEHYQPTLMPYEASIDDSLIHKVFFGAFRLVAPLDATPHGISWGQVLDDDVWTHTLANYEGDGELQELFLSIGSRVAYRLDVETGQIDYTPGVGKKRQEIMPDDTLHPFLMAEMAQWLEAISSARNKGLPQT